MHPNTFLRLVQEEAGLRNIEEATIATQVVFDVLHHRITPEEADDVRAQLPKDLAKLWEGGEGWFARLIAKLERQTTFTRTEFIREVNARKQDLKPSGETLIRAVFYALQSQITPGEASDVAAQLPKDLRELWDESRPLAPYVGGGVLSEGTEPPSLTEPGELP